jgi:hypothetical protein
MHHELAGTHYRLSYLQDRRALDSIDWPTAIEDLADVGAPLSQWRWCDVDRLTHVILATDRETRQFIGVLGLIERLEDQKPLLCIETVIVTPDETGALLGAMVAHALARVVDLDGVPVALSGPDAVRETLLGLSLKIRASGLYPPAGGNVVSFNAAKLGQRLGPLYTVLELEAVKKASLLRDLKGVHGLRPVRLKSSAGQRSSIPKSARSGTATRRPRKATHTGRIG